MKIFKQLFVEPLKTPKTKVLVFVFFGSFVVILLMEIIFHRTGLNDI